MSEVEKFFVVSASRGVFIGTFGNSNVAIFANDYDMLPYGVRSVISFDTQSIAETMLSQMSDQAADEEFYVDSVMVPNYLKFTRHIDYTWLAKNGLGDAVEGIFDAIEPLNETIH